jgi:hypothetical protein
MKVGLALFFTAVACCAVAKPTKFDAGAFAVTMNVTDENWFVDAQPKLNFVHFQKTGGVGFAHGAAFEGFIFVDRVPEEVPGELQKWFAGYLQRTTGFLHTKIFDQSRSFRPAKDNPVKVGDRTLIRFDMVPWPLSRPASWTKVEEEGVVFFLVLPEFEKHRTFFVFTGRQVLSRDMGQRSELGEVEQMITGFELVLPKNGQPSAKDRNAD